MAEHNVPSELADFANRLINCLDFCPSVMVGTSITAEMTHRIFISHAAIDAQVATSVADLIRRCDPAAQVFVASRPGDIAAGQEWHAAIQAELRAATAYVVILTPSSVSRP